MENDGPSSSSRSRREKKDKFGRFAALQKLKQLKGSKHKFEVEEIENVYDVVDDKDFVKKVTERQQDDWIVDDGDGGYVEDGREIFDDDLDDESIQKASKQSLAGPKKRKHPETKTKGNILNMLQSMPSKKTEKKNDEDDDILGSMLKELESQKPSTPKAATNKFATHKVTPKIDKKPIEIDEAIFDAPAKRIKASPIAEVSKAKSETKNETDQSNKNKIKIDERASAEDDSGIEAKKPKLSDSEAKISETQTTEEMYSQYATEFPDDDFECQDISEMSSTLTETTQITQKVPKAKIDIVEEEDIDALLSNADMFDQWNFEVDPSADKREDSLPDISKDLSKMITKNSEGDSVLRFFWLDASEDPYRQPGVINLFGKIHVQSSNTYVSCCLTVKNIPRRIYILPRETLPNGEPNTMMNVYQEFNELANRHKITEFRSQTVKKNYAFEIEGIPIESEYLEVRYSAAHPAIPMDYNGKTIEHIFGTTVNALELFLIERDIKGPCWLEIKNPLIAESLGTWCQVQVNCLKMEHVSVNKIEDREQLTIPPMTVTTLNITTSLNTKEQHNEIVMISVLTHKAFQIDKAAPKPPFEQHCCFVTHPRNVPWPLYAVDKLRKFEATNVIICDSESDLLEKFLDKLQLLDPDILIGYDCGFQFDVLTRRLVALKVKNPSRTSKIKRNLLPFIKGKIMLQQIFCGRPICDLQICAKEVNLKVRNYDLGTLCSAVLKTHENHIKEIKPSNCPQFYADAEKILGLVKIVMTETSYILTLICEMNILPLALQITSIAGNVLSRTLSAGRAERNEFLLLHAFTKRGYLTPDRKIQNKKNEKDSVKKKAAYAGGLVLEPKKGYYDNLILLMDFNSLYPSIIQEYNLCFTTIPGVCFKELTNEDLPDGDVATGVIPTEIRKLVESRSEVKKLLKYGTNLSPELKLQYNIRQLALKLTANSMYGCLGAAHCRFYAKNLAALVTAKGREILQNTKILVEKLNFDVVYGDTDSIMINTNISNYDEAFGIAKKIKVEVNKLYKKIELDIDGVFRYMLLLNKKKYAAVLMSKSPSGSLEYHTELKGLDIVRRDWCQLACDVGKHIIDQIFTEHPIEEKTAKVRDYLEKIAENLRSQKTPLSALVITKQLSKDPKDYPQKSQPHVAVALRLNKLGGRMWKAGDTVPYIICNDGTNNSAVERAYHIDEYKKNDDLALDIDYYLISQIIAVLQRICTPIPELGGGFLAECLGVADKYKPPPVATASYGGDEDESSSYQYSQRTNYEPLVFKCQECQKDIEIREFWTKVDNKKVAALVSCPTGSCKKAPWTYVHFIQNQLQATIKGFIDRYYQQHYNCSNSECHYTSDVLQPGAFDFSKNLPICPICPEGVLKREFNETMLYDQMSFYLDCFDVERHGKDLDIPLQPEVIAAYDKLKQFVERYLRKNSYSIVDLSKIFLCMRHFEPNQEESLTS